MRKVILTMKKQNHYEVIKKLVETNGNKNRIAIKLNCSKRHINRLINIYKISGKAGFVHGNKGRKPSISYNDELKLSVINLYKTKYIGSNFTHFSQLLLRLENIKLSDSTINLWLKEQSILSPKAHKSTKKWLKKKLKLELSLTNSNKQKVILDETLNSIDDYNAHPRRPRSSFFGEMVQMDASLHNWFGDTKTQLHLAIDDASGRIVGAYFDYQETLNGYYHVLKQILTNHGIPAMFFTDRRTVFEYKLKNAPTDADDTFTQFAYACHQLGIDIKTSSIPQAKGRVERLNQTLQSRLVIELRLAGITTIEAANEFLNSYIEDFNASFSLLLNCTKTVFEKQPSNQRINELLSVLSPRKIDSGHSIKFKNKYYIPITNKGKKIYFKNKSDALVIESFDSTLYVNILDQIYLLEEIPQHYSSSKEFDSIEIIPILKKKYIPPMTHPWRHSSYIKFVETQKHRQDSANV